MCAFLSKFHCELNPIKMVCLLFISLMSAKVSIYSTRVGVSIGIGKFRKPILEWHGGLHVSVLMHAQLRLSGNSSTSLGGLWVLINWA